MPATYGSGLPAGRTSAPLAPQARFFLVPFSLDIAPRYISIDIDQPAFNRDRLKAEKLIDSKVLEQPERCREYKMADKKRARVHVRLSLPNGGNLDEADIALIETVHKCRSILGASKILGLSYRKTWLMTDALNRTFETKVFETFPGRRGGGAEITPFGERLVALFRSIERRSSTSAAAALGELTASLDWSFAAENSGEEQEAKSH